MHFGNRKIFKFNEIQVSVLLFKILLTNQFDFDVMLIEKAERQESEAVKEGLNIFYKIVCLQGRFFTFAL